MEFNYFDIVASVFILLLGLKGILNGFFKEIFGLIGIIGGIFIASRVGNQVGQVMSDMIFKFENTSAINFTGFLTTLAVFWLFMVVVGQIFKKLSAMSGLGILDRIFGFIFGASKFFLIAAVIAHSVYNLKAIKSTIDENLSTSILFPILVETGGVIMKLDPVEITDKIESTTDKTVSSLSSSTKKIIEETKKHIEEVMPNQLKNSNEER